MKKYRKKPVVIEAIQFNGDNVEEIREFIGVPFEKCEITREYWIPTLEGLHAARKDDWIIKGIKGEFYPCKPDIFKATYEAVDRVKEKKDGKKMQK